MLKVILGLFGAFPIFDNPVSRKRLAVEQKGVTFGPQGEYSVYIGYFRHGFWRPLLHWAGVYTGSPGNTPTQWRNGRHTRITQHALIHTVRTTMCSNVLRGLVGNVLDCGGASQFALSDKALFHAGTRSNPSQD